MDKVQIRLSGNLIVFFITILLLWTSNILATTDHYRFIIPNGILPDSFDPIEIDQFNNYFPGQMIYATPMSVSTKGELQSRLLQNFQYDQEKGKIFLTLKEGIFFTDDTPIHAEDIAFAISRLLFARTKFPVFKYIKGKEKWLAEEFPLKSFPEGIKINDNNIEIELTHPVVNPLFRLTMTVTSVIPKKCVDLQTNELKCDSIPGSGYYKEVSRTKEGVHYKRREDLTFDSKNSPPQNISFLYPTVTDLRAYLKTLGDRDVIFVYDLDINHQDYLLFNKKYNFRRLGSAWFSGIVLNPAIEPFNDPSCRRLFLDEFYNAFSKLKRGPVVNSKSLFTKLVPGYLNDEDLTGTSSLSEEIVKKCQQKFKNKTFDWGIRKKTTPSLVAETLGKVQKKLKIQLNAPEIAPGSHSGWSSYKKKTIAFQTTHSGFWPLDPIGDIQMLFTPKLHEDYIDIWTDKDINSLISNLGAIRNKSEAPQIMEKINRTIYQKSIMSIFSHQSYSYISKYQANQADIIGSFSLTVPYPWEIF